MRFSFGKDNGNQGFSPEYQSPLARRLSANKLNIILLAVTILTTVTAGAIQAEVNPLSNPLKIYRGFPFAITLLGILGGHEMGHYFTSRKWGVKTSLPYFIPAPTFIGTFGALIKMKSQIPNRKALVEIGAAGPITGFILALIASILGLRLSGSVPTSETVGGISLGGSLIFSFLQDFVIGNTLPNETVVLHPVAFAGWLGFFVTALNLLPIGQLDGGHIMYGILGRRHTLIGRLVVLALFPLGFMWAGWFIWAILALFLVGIGHPPPFDSYAPLDEKSKFIGGVAILILILTFIPNPFTVKP